MYTISIALGIFSHTIYNISSIGFVLHCVRKCFLDKVMMEMQHTRLLCLCALVPIMYNTMECSNSHAATLLCLSFAFSAISTILGKNPSAFYDIRRNAASGFTIEKYLKIHKNFLISFSFKVF